ncbi:mechanosensitive ion channel domain-containing protein [Desulfosediminicola sp.]|uniref:mechanosensitive ion channel domain-containing protein n=1 Tax=Desulfosediminicola sp. TaxID=2886825 RepID=UPI003AF2F760
MQLSFSRCALPAHQLIVATFVIFAIILFQPLLSDAWYSIAQETPQNAPSSEADIHTLLSGLSDEQVRRLLIDELKKDSTALESSADTTGPDIFLGKILYSLSSQSDTSEQHVRQLFSHIPQVIPDLKKAFIKLCPYGTHTGALKNFLWVLFFIGIGLLTELVFNRIVLWKLFNKRAEFQENQSASEKIVSAIINEVPTLLSLFIFSVAAYFSYLAFIWTDSPLVQLLFLAVLLSIIMIRLVAIVSRLIFSPSSEHLRIVPLDCKIAGSMHRLFSGAAAYLTLGVMLAVTLKRLGAHSTTIALIMLVLASILLIAAAVAVLIFKNRVREQIIAGSTASGDSISWGRQQFASMWHLLALAYLFVLWLLLFNDLIDPTHRSKGAFILSFFVVPIWMLSDKLLQWIVLYAVDTLKIHQEHYDQEEDVDDEELEKREKGKKSYLRALAISRVGLVGTLAIWVATLWNIKIPIFSNLSSVVFDALIVMTLALMFWKFISNWIERKIQESIPEEDEKNEEEQDEWGSASARGRSYTLLPMIRRFLGTVLMVMVTMTILSSTGVDIGPLLAGAGVVGLAVGFGAQKLVADMFSGFFYLLDDAFRVGEYVEAGGISGTVENISLRNVMLRHHRGMLQIVPHSELGAITNYMRGGIVVKFNLDFPYDADIDQIRKVIKKVGQAMLQEEEFAEDFIRPVKSQGVREISNSVMTIRVKFTAKPGAHFIIRREAYKRITEALRAKGIHYAHKKVIVDIPQSSGEEDDSEQLAKAAGAATRQIMDEESKVAGAPKTESPAFDR